MPARSKRQAGWLGLIASGKKVTPNLSQEQAREMLRGSDVRHLPRSAPPAHPRRRHHAAGKGQPPSSLSELLRKKKKK